LGSAGTLTFQFARGMENRDKGTLYGPQAGKMPQLKETTGAGKKAKWTNGDD